MRRLVCNQSDEMIMSQVMCTHDSKNDVLDKGDNMKGTVYGQIAVK